MSTTTLPIVVFGATGQQGGSVAAALIKTGWSVRALVREPQAAKSRALSQAGVELVQGTFADKDALQRALRGAYGVFSVQPSSPGGTVSDEQETQIGITLAHMAADCGVQHLVYSSGAAVRDTPTGVGHFDSKARIEAVVRSLPISSTIIRPATFMEMLLMPGFGLNEGCFTFFMRPEESMQFLAVEDIGKMVSVIFADAARFTGQTIEIASDVVTGQQLATLFSAAAGRPIAYQRFSAKTLAENTFLQKLTALFDQGILAGQADLQALQRLCPDLQSFQSWLASSGHAAFHTALGKAGAWEYAKQR